MSLRDRRIDAEKVERQKLEMEQRERRNYEMGFMEIERKRELDRQRRKEEERSRIEYEQRLDRERLMKESAGINSMIEKHFSQSLNNNKKVCDHDVMY